MPDGVSPIYGILGRRIAASVPYQLYIYGGREYIAE